MAEATISLRLTLQVANDPISGSLHDADGRTHAFGGWIALATALQALIDAPRHDSPQHATARSTTSASQITSNGSISNEVS